MGRKSMKPCTAKAAGMENPCSKNVGQLRQAEGERRERPSDVVKPACAKAYGCGKKNAKEAPKQDKSKKATQAQYKSRFAGEGVAPPIDDNGIDG